MNTPYYAELIINRPEHLTRRKRIADTSLTIIFWLLLLYMWQPLLSLIAWCFNIKLFYDHMIILEGYRDFFDIVYFYINTILIMGAFLLVWARINQYRFKGKDKRKVNTVINTEDQAKLFNINPENLTQWKELKNCSVIVNDEGVVQNVHVS